MDRRPRRSPLLYKAKKIARKELSESEVKKLARMVAQQGGK
jgi:hypothetical protein